MAELEGRTALITGAGRGMGAAHARLLAAEGAAVIVQDIDGDLAAATAAAIKADGGDARALVGDVADVADLQAKIGALAAAAGGIDILVNNAGIGGAARSRRSTRRPSTRCSTSMSRAASSRPEP